MKLLIFTRFRPFISKNMAYELKILSTRNKMQLLNLLKNLVRCSQYYDSIYNVYKVCIKNNSLVKIAFIKGGVLYTL